MPQFNTGNQIWDQGLNSAATGLSALFDPTRIAQAGYYGAEARKAQMDALQKQRQFDASDQVGRWDSSNNWNSSAVSLPPGVNLAGSGSPTPPLSATVAGPPPPQAAAPPGPPPPVAAPPGPAAGPPPQVAAPPGPPAPQAAASAPGPAAGTVGANMAPGALGALMAQGGGAVPTPASASATMDAVLAAAPQLSSGSPPPADSPAPNSGAPVAPNTTASDGSVPTNEPTSGIFHPGSITSADGGKKVTGPANANGSQALPSFTLAQYIGKATEAGLTFEQAKLRGQALIESLYDAHRIDETMYHHMMGSMDPSIINQDTASRTAITTTGMSTQAQRDVANIQAGSAADVANINQAGALKVAGLPPETIVDPNDPNKVTVLPRGAIPTTGIQGYNPNAVSTAIAPVTTQPGGPGTPTYSTPTATAQRDKIPLYQQTPEQQQGAVGTYIDPTNPTALIQTTAADAANRGLKVPPKTMEEWQALAQSASVNAKTEAEAQAIRDRVMANAPVQKTTTPNESVQNSNIIDQQLSMAMPVPVRSGLLGTGAFAGAKTNMLPSGASEAAGEMLQDLTDQYFTRNPSTRGNRVASAKAAIQQLIREGYIDPNQSRDVSGAPGSADASTINKGLYHKDGSISQEPRFRVDVKDPHTGKVFGPGEAPKVKMDTPMSATVTANTDTPPPGALGPAPPGTPDETMGTTNTGQRSVVRGGWVFPAP